MSGLIWSPADAAVDQLDGTDSATGTHTLEPAREDFALRAPAELCGDLTFSEERVNQITHAAPVPLTILGTVLLVQAAQRTGNSWLTCGCLLYGLSLIAVYLFSALSHSFRPGRWRNLFRTLDQVAIFGLVSGSFSPIGLTICRGGNGWTLLATMWTLSIIGMLTKLFVTRLKNVSVWFYLAVGLMPLLSMGRCCEWFPSAGLAWILAGGGFYLLGTYFFINDLRVRHFHGVWHVMVVAAGACHFIVMYCYLVPGLN